LQLCKSLELLIANGRLGKDQGTGAWTCKNSSRWLLYSVTCFIFMLLILKFYHLITW
jgi:hypothetical protein